MNEKSPTRGGRSKKKDLIGAMSSTHDRDMCRGVETAIIKRKSARDLARGDACRSCAGVFRIGEVMRASPVMKEAPGALVLRNEAMCALCLQGGGEEVNLHPSQWPSSLRETEIAVPLP